MGGDARTLIEDGGVLIFAVAGVALRATFEPAVEGAAEVPTARALEQIAADGRHRAQLGSRGVADGPRQERQARRDLGVALDVSKRRERADVERAAGVEAEIAQRTRGLEIEETRGSGKARFHQRQEVGAASEDDGFRRSRQRRDGLARAGGGCMVKCVHGYFLVWASGGRSHTCLRRQLIRALWWSKYSRRPVRTGMSAPPQTGMSAPPQTGMSAPPRVFPGRHHSSSISSTRSGVSGRALTGRPSAWATALAMAPGVGMIGGSPAPREPSVLAWMLG